MEISLDGKVALVTGAGPNIGSGIALALSRYGARVACNDLDPSAAKAAVRRIERNGGKPVICTISGYHRSGGRCVKLGTRLREVTIKTRLALRRMGVGATAKPHHGQSHER